MALPAKTDYIGLASNAALSLKSSSLNDSANNVEAQNEIGDVVANDLLSPNASPSCTYEVIAALALGSIKLGKISTIGTGASARAFAITEISVNTAPATVPELVVTTEEVENTATDANSTTIDAGELSLAQWHDAQILGGAFELEGTGCYINGCNYAIRGELTKATVNGKCVAHDIQNGRIECQVTIVQSSSTPPTLAAGTGWQVTSPLTPDNPDEDYPTWTATVTKYLTSTHPSSSSSSNNSPS